MKTKYPRIFGLLAAVMLVASFVVPASLISPAPVEADPGICKWDALTTPAYIPMKNDIRAASDILDMATGGDGATILFIGKTYLTASEVGLLMGTAYVPYAGARMLLYYSNNGGISITGSKALNLLRDWTKSGQAQWKGEKMYGVAIAPDDPKFFAVTTDTPGTVDSGPKQVWITSDSGSTWDYTGLALGATHTIRTIDISVDYGGRRDIAVGTYNSAGDGLIYVIKSTGFTGWLLQDNPTTGINYFALKFSPTYSGDAALAMVYANTDNTYFNIGLRDIDKNETKNWAFGALDVEVATPTNLNCSPGSAKLNKADLELPSDFSGQAASLRRAYISLDAYGTTGLCDGIYRVDDTTVYELMATGAQANKKIYSIAYFGTYASGKLLAGERRGYPCTATVPTWFTDSPTTCPIPCWYPALKPTTGAASGDTSCTPLTGQMGDGGAIVAWRADGKLAYAGTGSLLLNDGDTWFTEQGTGDPRDTIYDESALALSRNNGETWNQIGYIDTLIKQFTDVAPTPDCKTIYLASVNDTSDNSTNTCLGFDSVWRTSNNTDVVAPYPALPVGIFWERVFTHVTSTSCNVTQTNLALLRIVPYCADPSGQIVAWAAWNTKAQAWSPDYGDYWATITPREAIQDFCFESSTVLYNLSPGGLVQKLPYTGTAWSTTLSSVDTLLFIAHTIAAYPEGKVLVGAASTASGALWAASYSGNFNTDNPSFSPMALAGRTTYMANAHVAFDPAFKDNNTIFLAEGSTGITGGTVYRNNPTTQIRWGDTDMMAATNGAIGCPSGAPHQLGQYGIVLAFTGQALYSAHTSSGTYGQTGYVGCAVDRTIDDGTGKYGPLSGMPKPGIAWDCLDVFVSPPASRNPCFTLEPSSLKACGCCTLDTDTTLYAIDDAVYNPGAARTGLVWAFTDCMAKKGPKLITADKTLIGCDPVSGRAQEVNLCWEQLCVADAYDIEIAKSADFTIKIIDWVAESDCGGLKPADVTKPCVYFPAGGAVTGPTPAVGTIGSAIAAWGNLECGHTYYWRVKVRECATTQVIRSPWSEARSFTIKAGLPVTTPYYGVQLLSPNNGGLGIPVKPVSFSWSPFKETTKYKFVLAKDAAMTQVVKEADLATTAFEYDGTLEYSSNYFWRVMSVEPAPSDWSATFSFLTEAAPPVAPGPTPAPPTPMWVWVVIALGAILVIVTLVLIFKTRRV